MGADIQDNPESYVSSNPRVRHCSFYMKEFVARADVICQALLAREALPDENLCFKCVTAMGKWRCIDCIAGHLLCRGCMRHAHFPNPFHRIECWNGIYFRAAALWEVGVYLSLRHHQTPTVCANLKWQSRVLEILQEQKDQHDPLENEPPPVHTSFSGPVPDPEPMSDPERDAANDSSIMRMLDQMLEGANPDSILEEDDEAEGHDLEAEVGDNDVGAAAGFQTYIQQPNDWPNTGYIPAANVTPEAPRQDALNNQYVWVVHTNGIHHIALVSCTCRGQQNIIDDLFYAQMVPVSFERVRTLFTTAVLDRFRLSNLEMKSSAYQFFQMLRRLTKPMNPASVVNLYHELRRLSRLWRWVKKLKWAGYGQEDPNDTFEPRPGELALFCPACPQEGINLPETWKEDENRWVYQWIFTADGNFKADHVRQKCAADDIWLSDGLGMTTGRVGYKEFLETAQERSTVSHFHGLFDPADSRTCTRSHTR